MDKVPTQWKLLLVRIFFAPHIWKIIKCTSLLSICPFNSLFLATTKEYRQRFCLIDKYYAIKIVMESEILCLFF